MRRSLARLAVVGTAALVLAGCGVQLDAAPRELAAETVPYGLLETSTTTTTVVGDRLTRVPSFHAASIYLVDNDNYLVEVRRQLQGDRRVEASLGSLLTPPSDAEVNSGLRSVIASSTVLRGVAGPENGLVTIDLSSEVSDVSLDSVRLALSQIVYTATAVPGVERVLFQVDGQAREVPTGEGQSTAEPLSRIDYRQYVRPPTTTTTTTLPPEVGDGP